MIDLELLDRIDLMRIFKILIIIFLIGTNTANAETLTFKSVLDKAVKNSYDLQTSQIDIKISATEIKEAKAEYFPLVSLNYNAQYDRDLTNGSSALTSVGDSMVSNNTKYQNAISAGLQYNLYDFGIRKKKLDIAKTDKIQKETDYIKNLRNFKISLSDTYTKAILLNKELKSNEELLVLNKTIFSLSKDLYNSGTTRKTDMADQALTVAVLINKIDNLKTEYTKALEDISFYTEDNYSTAVQLLNLLEEDQKVEPELVKNTGKIATAPVTAALISAPVNNTLRTAPIPAARIFAPLSAPVTAFVPTNYIQQKPLSIEITESEILDLEELPEYKTYQLEIEKKQAELDILKRQNLPQFKFSTSYYLYGTDKDNFLKTFKDIEDRSLTFRVSSNLPVFDGMKNKAQREKAKLEIEKLALERDKQAQTIKSFYEKAYEEAKNANQRL